MGDLLVKNYNAPVQKKGRGRITNYKQITNYNVQNYKGNGVFEVHQALNQIIINPKGSHGLHQGSFKLQTMTALIKSFYGGSRGAVFSKRAPLAAGGRTKMVYRKKSPYECSVEELDRELIARGARIPEQQRFNFKDKKGTPVRDAIMAQVKEFYRQASSLSPDAALGHISTWELAEALVYMTEGVPLDHTRAISGSDDRKDIFQLKDNPANEPIKKNALSVVAICMEEDLIHQDNQYSTLEHKNYGKTFNLCRCEPFYQQPVAAGHLFSGFLVKEDVIATAGHCVDENNVTNTRIVFGFRMKDSSTAVTLVSNQDIYKGVKIIQRYHNRMGTGSDWSLVQLDRKVQGRQVVKFPGTEISTRQPVYVIGHPCGLPLKYAAGAEVRKIKDTYFVADLDIYAGSSGSPIFDKNTHEVIGMVVRGYHRDFRWTGKCYISVKHPTPGMNSPNQKFLRMLHGSRGAVFQKSPPGRRRHGAECTRVSEFIKYCQ